MTSCSRLRTLNVAAAAWMVLALSAASSALPADIHRDFIIDTADVSVLYQVYGQTSADSNITGDSTIEFADVAFMGWKYGNRIDSVTIVSDTNRVTFNDTLSLSAFAVFLDSSSESLQGYIAWSASDTALAAVDSSGILSGSASGTVTISATFAGRYTVAGTRPMVVAPLRVDAIPGAAGCGGLTISGDSHAVTPVGYNAFSGYADPCLRKDPDTSILWLAYSWPHYRQDSTPYVPSVEIHLARSTNSGDSWTYISKLWEPESMANPANAGQHGYLDHETPNFLPVDDGETATWYAARLNYFIPDSGGFAARPSNSFHISLLKASSPESLASAPSGRIGGTFTHANWNAQSLVPPELAASFFFWNEPALYFEAGKLYLVMVSFVYVGSAPDMSRSNVFVYSTSPTGDPDSWAWSFRGKLTNDSDANELGGQGLTQVDIARGTDGKLLLIVTPDDWNSGLSDYNHKGCKVIEIKSLETPELARDGQGNLRLRTVITASDANDLGSGASTYDPNSNSGVIFTRRIKTATSLTADIWRTSLRP